MTSRCRSSFRVAERIRRRVPALQAHLMRPQPILEFDEEVGIERHSTRGVRIDLGHPPADAIGIELRVPRRVERVRQVDSPAITADLDHLRSTIERAFRVLRVWRTAYHSADRQRAGELRIEWVAHVVLTELAAAEAAHVEEAVVEREIDVRDQRRNGLETLEQRRELRRIGRLGGYLDDLARLPATARFVVIPHPYRARQVLEAEHHAREPIAPSRIVCGPQLQHHLLLGTELQLLQVRTAPQIPDVQRVAILAREQQLRVDTARHHVRRPPLAGDHDVVTEVPCEIVREVLWPAVSLPAPPELERLVVEHEDAARSIPVRAAECVHVDAVGTAVHGVRCGVSRLRDHLFTLNDLHEARVARVGRRVDDVDARAARSRHYEISTFHVRIGRVCAEMRAAGVPAEMMQLVATVREIQLAHEPPVVARCRIGVDDTEGVLLSVLPGREERDVRQRLGWRLAGHPGRRIERGIGKHACHGSRPRAKSSWWPGKFPPEYATTIVRTRARCLEMAWRLSGAFVEIAGAREITTPQQAVRTRWLARRRAPPALGLPPRPRIRQAESTPRWEA